MENTNTNYFLESKNDVKEKILSIFSFDSIGVRARVTFDSYVFQGIQVTYWMDDDKDVEERIDSIFEIFFNEVIKNREMNQSKLVKI